MAEHNLHALDVVRIIRAGVLYFAFVFAAGFILGMLRVMFLVPVLETRAAELAEIPFMLAISYFFARTLTRRMSIPSRVSDRALMGASALVLMLAAEFGLVLWLRGMDLAGYFATRDPVSTVGYYIALFAFAAMPLIVRRAKTGFELNAR